MIQKSWDTKVMENILMNVVDQTLHLMIGIALDQHCKLLHKQELHALHIRAHKSTLCSTHQSIIS